jgi:hypothetical protein
MRIKLRRSLISSVSLKCPFLMATTLSLMLPALGLVLKRMPLGQQELSKLVSGPRDKLRLRRVFMLLFLLSASPLNA